jgi:uncharacterized Zn finger protein
MGWFYSFRPYVPVAKRRAKALREVERRRKNGLAVSPVEISGRVIADSFWGKAWCDNLESYSDFANRLPRGRTYVRNGSVVHLQINPGKVSAIVSGSELYDVEVKIAALPKTSWAYAKSRCGGQIGSLVELLQGRLSKHVMEVVTERERGLFPKPAEISMKCSCPDWAIMCKHVAAVLYGVAARLDTQPELLFRLRKVNHLELIEEAGQAERIGASGETQSKTLAVTELADVFGIEMAEPSEKKPTRKETPSRKRPSNRRPVDPVVPIAKKPAKAQRVAMKKPAKIKARRQPAAAARNRRPETVRA